MINVRKRGVSTATVVNDGSVKEISLRRPMSCTINNKVILVRLFYNSIKSYLHKETDV